MSLTILDLDFFLFDFDDTLILSWEELIKKYVYLGNNELNLPQITEEDWKKVWGKPFKKSIELLYPSVQPNRIQEVMQCFRERAPEVKLPAPNGAVTAIQRSKEKYPIGILTSRKGNFDFRLENAGYKKDWFEICVTANENPFSKPDWRAILPVSEWAELKSYKNFVYFGDHLIDFNFVENLKEQGCSIIFLAVTTGLITKQQFLDADQPGELIFPSIVEAANYLLSTNSS